MATTSIAKRTVSEDVISQGDIFENIKYSYISSEDSENVNVIEMTFPYSVIMSQGCDVISMYKFQKEKSGKATKFMPAILLCPIYNATMLKNGEHLKNVSPNLNIEVKYENIYDKHDKKVADRDWHYRFHSLTIEVNKKTVLENAIIDFKHYFTVPMSYLIDNKDKQILHLNDVFAQQLTLQFCTYLARVGIPD